MAISAEVQTLTAAFSFGIVLQAATGALLVYFRGHGPTILKDGRRLVLVLFLLCAAFWAQVDFLNLMILNSSACQATTALSTAFDQLARFSLEQFLFWSLLQRAKLDAGQMILQAILAIRLIAGCTLIGFTRADLSPVCGARNSLKPVAIIVLALDFVIIGFVLVRSATSGMLRDMRDPVSNTRDQSRGLILTVVGLAVWSGVSVPMILGVPTSILLVRTAVPANGLLILVCILTFSAGSLLDVREEITTPEAHSPFVAPSAPSRQTFRETVGAGSPIPSYSYNRAGGLFVVNPSSTPGESPTVAPIYYHASAKGSKNLGEVAVTGGGSTETVPTTMTGYRGSSGVFPAIVTSSGDHDQGALAPVIRSNTFDTMRNLPIPSISRPTAQHQRSLLGRLRPAKPTKKGLEISHPVMAEDATSSQKTLAKIRSIDLAQAAVNERERREAAADRSRLVASRPAPLPPQQSQPPAEEVLRIGVSVKRKEVPVSNQREPVPTTISSPSSTLVVPGICGTTSSALISPRREELRRRSPRNAGSFEKLVDQPRALPSMQRKQSIGLPSNPRATKIGLSPPMKQEQTLILVNDIVYNDPSLVKDIMKDAPDIFPSAQEANTCAKLSIAPLTTHTEASGSIMHRPRPCRKNTDGDRAFFRIKPPQLRRSKSESSITDQNILTSDSGSPTQLRPLPALPTNASDLPRLLPSNSRSMTFDEKIQLLFPAPPGSTVMHNRRSSLPSVPSLPSISKPESPPTQSTTPNQQQSLRDSKMGTIAPLDTPELPAASIEGQSNTGEPLKSRFSVSTIRTQADQVGETWIPGIPGIEINAGGLSTYIVGIDPHILETTRKSNTTETRTGSMSNGDGSTTDWGSIHFETPPIDLSKLMTNPNSTFVQGTRACTLEEAKPAPESNLPREEELRNGEESMRVMFEREEPRQSILQSSDGNPQSFFLDSDQSSMGDETPNIKPGRTWHRRIGDELPTFSDRKPSKWRKMPPPTPLLLNQRGRRAKVVVRTAPPSPPSMDSPERAIAQIQAQLKRLEDPDLGSVRSQLRYMPNASLNGEDAESEKRRKLLENLENEIGQQENQWQQMQMDLDRDSPSSIMTPQAPVRTGASLSRESSQRSHRTPSQVISRRARIRSSMTVRSRGDDSTCTTSTQSSDNSRASIWQQRLAEAQMEYLENAPVLLRNRSLNFLSVSKSQQMGSPTPPDSVDSGTDTETESERNSQIKHQKYGGSRISPSLWEPELPSPKAAFSCLWKPPYKMTEQVTFSPEPPAKNVRRIKRQLHPPLFITSSYLWSKPVSAVQNRPVVGLWQSKPARPMTIRTRPVTQRPPRRPKRVTLLPDIIESPLPLPNKRDTLGIFQFPWGAISDSAVYQPAFNPALLIGPVLNSKLDSLYPELDYEEYASSFFDEYDEDMDDDEYPESDDDFDETTLWEIASLLKSGDVPSRNSLLPPPREIIEDYDDDTEFEEDKEANEINRELKAAQQPKMKLPIMPLVTSSKEDLQKKQTLWTAGPAANLEANMPGLPGPEQKVGESYIPSPEDAFCSKPHLSQKLPTLASRDLCAVSSSEVQGASPSPMWSRSTAPTPEQASRHLWMPKSAQFKEKTTASFSLDVQRSQFWTTTATPSSSFTGLTSVSNLPFATLPSKGLWAPGQSSKNPSTEWTLTTSNEGGTQTLGVAAPKLKTSAVPRLGLSSHSRSNYLSSSGSPVAQNITFSSRSCTNPLLQITSTSLWSGVNETSYEHHWISESSVRPPSPSVYTESSSGRSSPASETSSVSGVSLESSNAKASSIWGSTESASTPIWWGAKGSDKSPNEPPDEKHKSSTELSILTPKGLEPVMQSRHLARRDMWEARTCVAGDDMLRRQFRQLIVVENDAKDIHQSLHSELRPAVASKTEKDGALSEGVADGILRKTNSRPVASEADWEAALNEAILKSKVHLPILHNSLEKRKAGPEEANEKEVIPKAVLSPRHDPTVRHPVFFTESLCSTSSEVHPAAIGYVNVNATQ